MRALTSRLAVLVVLAAVGLVAACGSAEDAADSDETTTPAESSTSSADEEETEPAPPEATEATEEEATDGAGAREVAGTGYSVGLPKGWTDVTSEAAASQPLVDLAIADPTGTFRTNFNVVQPQPFAGTEQQLVDQSARELRSVTRNKVRPLDPTDFDGVSAPGQTSVLSTAQGDVTLIQHLVVRDGELHPVTMTFLSSTAPKATAVMRDVIASWRWT